MIKQYSHGVMSSKLGDRNPFQIPILSYGHVALLFLALAMSSAGLEAQRTVRPESLIGEVVRLDVAVQSSPTSESVSGAVVAANEAAITVFVPGRQAVVVPLGAIQRAQV
ncbi:MAG TPA: hypothetical protein VF832_04300, partial [Longimicrobiales bacterium]